MFLLLRHAFAEMIYNHSRKGLLTCLILDKHNMFLLFCLYTSLLEGMVLVLLVEKVVKA